MPSSSDSLDNAEKELSQVEETLQEERPFWGRAGMNSIRDSLANVASLLRLSVSSGDSARQRLSERLETAQLAFSSRTPIGVVQARQEQRSQSMPSIEVRVSVTSISITSSQRRPSLLPFSQHQARQAAPFQAEVLRAG